MIRVRVIPSIREQTEVHITKSERLHDRDGLIVEHLDFGLGDIKGEDERKERWMDSAIGLVWD